MKIHGHPQKADYLPDGSDWPMFEAQGWWPEHDPIDAGHLHLGVKFPVWGELTSLDTIACPFTIKLHDVAGSVVALFGKHIKAIVWNDTGSSTPPVMRSTDPGLNEWSGVLTLDFTLGEQPWIGDFFPKHGWTGSIFTARALFDNGDLLETQLIVSFFSALDTSVPEKPAAEQGIPGLVVSSRVTVTNQTIPNNDSGLTLGRTSFGAMVMELNGWWPLLPFDVDWPTIVNFYNYTANTPLPNGLFQQILDANLHGTPPNIPPNEGTLLESVAATTAGIPGRPLILKPAAMGAGKHKNLLRWRQERNGESLSAVLSLPVTIGAGVPPPPPPVDPPPPAKTGVPNVIGLSESAALAAIQAARLTGIVVAKPIVLSVVSQTPAAGAVVNVGSLVTITVPKPQ